MTSIWLKEHYNGHTLAHIVLWLKSRLSNQAKYSKREGIANGNAESQSDPDRYRKERCTTINYFGKCQLTKERKQANNSARHRF